jgi:hypothetical protein
MEKKSLYERIENWYEGAAEWQRFLIIAGIVAFLLLLLVFTIVMPIILAIRCHNAAWLLVWIVPISFHTAFRIMNDGDIDL